MMNISMYDYLWNDIRMLCTLVIIVGCMLTQAINISPDQHIDLYCFGGLTLIVIVWVVISIIKTALKIKKNSNYGAVFVNESM